MASDGSGQIIAFPIVQQTVIHSASCQLVITCRCGNPTPLMVHFIPGVPVTAFCPGCQMKFKLGRFIYDIEKGEQVNVGVVEMMPTIVAPGGAFHG